MNPNNIKSGWWLIADNRFVTRYDSKEEAIDHIKYQKEIIGTHANWSILYIKINFGEFIEFPYEKDSTI